MTQQMKWQPVEDDWSNLDHSLSLRVKHDGATLLASDYTIQGVPHVKEHRLPDNIRLCALTPVDEASSVPALGVSMEQAQDLLVEKFNLSHPPKLRYTTFSHVYPDSGGPLGGIGGQALTTFWLDAWFDPNDGYAVIFYRDKVMEIMGFGEFDVCSTYQIRQQGEQRAKRASRVAIPDEVVEYLQWLCEYELSAMHDEQRVMGKDSIEPDRITKCHAALAWLEQMKEAK